MCPVREILYGGAKGGGKSEAIGPFAVKHLALYGEHATVLILRETMPQLRDLMRRIRPHCLRAGARFNKVEKTWAFPTGGQLIFGHLSEGCDPYWGQEYSLIIVDEVTRCLPTEVDYLELMGSLRSSHGVPCRIVLTSNPGGSGHNWVKQRFMGVPPLTVYKDPQSGLERVFIPASLKDNPKLPAEYRSTLEQLPDAEREAFLHGNWDAFEGRVFKIENGVHIWTWTQFNAFHQLDENNRTIPKEWTRFRSLDWGYAKPFACYWYAVAPGGRAYVYREYYGINKDSKGNPIPNEGSRTEPAKVAAKIAEIEREARESIEVGWTGPDLGHPVRADHGVGKPIESHFKEAGVYWKYWTASAGSRLAGKMALHQRLAYERNEAGDIMEWPGIVFIEGTCPHAIRTIQALEYDEHQTEQVDTDGEDHAYDSISGFCKMRPWEPKPKHRDTGWRHRTAPVASDWRTS